MTICSSAYPSFGSGLIIFAILNLDNFLVSTSMGSVQLGYYALAFTCSTFICMFLNETVNNVLLPTFTAMQHDDAAMRRWYLKTIELVSFVAVIANTVLLANAPFFLVTVLGKGTNKWLPATLALRILCIYGIVRSVTVPIGACIMARGHTNILLRANVLVAIVEILLLLLAIQLKSIELVAAAVLIAYLMQAFVYLPYLRLTFSITHAELIEPLWPEYPSDDCRVFEHFIFTSHIWHHILYIGDKSIVYRFRGCLNAWFIQPISLLP